MDENNKPVPVTVSEPEPEPAAAELPPVVERAFERLGMSAGQVRDRAEQIYAMYKLLKALGLSDADIAKLVVQKGGERLDEGLDRVRPTDARPVFDAVEQAVVRAAEEVDTRLDLGGDLIRRIREGTVAARAGREGALGGLERGLTRGRGNLRKLLHSIAAGEDSTKQ